MKKKNYSRGTDTVDAKLTPKESVLNRNASELAGRKKIAALNAEGNRLAAKGIDLASRHYQRGTSDVYARPHEDQGDAMMIDLSKLPLSPEQMNIMHLNREARNESERAKAMNETKQYQRGTSDVRRDDRADLLKEADAMFYGGGNAPAPTPTPTPAPRKYQYGTSNVGYTQYNRGIDYSASPAAAPTGAQGFGGAPTASMGGTGNLSFNSIPYGGSGGGFNAGGGITYTGGPGGFPTGQYNGPSGTNPNINVTAGSKGVSPLSTPIPDLRYADPNTLSRLQGGMENLVYNPSGGGYKFSEFVNTPGTQVLSPRYIGRYSDIGQDANANRTASAYYNYIGGLPTRPVGTPALNQLYGMTGQSPAPGPSYNSILGSPYKGPYGFGG